MPNQPRRSYSKRFSGQLRNNMTDPEVILWSYLRNRGLGGVKFRRQEPIGPFIVDFACYECRLVVEVDGDQHQPAVDAKRDAWISSRGWRAARFWAADVFSDLDMVLNEIRKAIASPRP